MKRMDEESAYEESSFENGKRNMKRLEATDEHEDLIGKYQDAVGSFDTKVLNPRVYSLGAVRARIKRALYWIGIIHQYESEHDITLLMPVELTREAAAGRINTRARTPRRENPIFLHNSDLAMG